MNEVYDSAGFQETATTTRLQAGDTRLIIIIIVCSLLLYSSMFLFNSPLTGVFTEYLIQYDDDDWLPGKWKNLSTYPGNLNSVILHLTPFTYYEFRISAINELGSSRPSRPSTRFQTSGARGSHSWLPWHICTSYFTPFL